MTTRAWLWRCLAVASAIFLCAAPAAAQTGPTCGGPVVEKCIVSVTSVNPGTPATLNASLQFNAGTGAFTLAVKNTANADQFELSPALATTSTVTVVFKLANGGTDPKIAVSTGLVSSWSINTAVVPHQLTIVAQPRGSSWNRASGCSPSSCANAADVDYSAFLLAAFDPMTSAPATLASKFAGGFIATNGQYFDPFPSYDTTTKALNFKVGSPHFKVGGATLNSGFARIFVTEAVITDLWGIAGGSAALAGNPNLANVTVAGSSASFVIDQTSGGVLIRIGESVPFSFSVPNIVITPVAASTGGGAVDTTPTIAGIGDQRVAVNASLTVPFNITVKSLESAWAESSDYSVVRPSPREASCDGSGNCSIVIVGARAGTTTVTVTVRDRGRLATTSFGVTVTDAASGGGTGGGGGSGSGGSSPPSPPRTPGATPSGSGAVLTWSTPDSGVPARYAIAGGTSPGGNNLPVMLTPDASTSYVIGSLPSGTYYFRIYAVTDGALGAASPEISVTVSNGAMPGFVSGVQASVDARSVTVTWDPSANGSGQAYYWVEFGSSPGGRDVAIVTSVARTYTRYMNPGTYWMRVRAILNGVVGPVSNDASIVVAPDGCSGAPRVPTLLPVTSGGGAVTFSWSAGGGDAADRYRIELSNGLTLTTPGAGTSFEWPQKSGSFSAHVIADNGCGSSARSNDVVFTIQP